MALAAVSPATAREIARLAALRVKARRQSAVVSVEDYPKITLRGDAIKLWNSTEHEVIISGPAETGKTFASLHRLNMLLWRYSGAQAAIVRKTYKSMHGTVLQTHRRILGSDSPVRPYGGEHAEFFDYPNGSRVYIGGMDNPQKVLSSERDFIHVNQAEELELGDWETLTTRCTGRGGVAPFAQIFGDCNPGPSTHWILNRPSLRVLYSHHEDNPTLFDGVGIITEQGKRTMQVLDALTGVRYKRLRLGLWVGAEGMVYEEWNREDHLIDRFDIPQDWRRFRVIDFGFTNPFSCLWAAMDHDGRLYIYRELYGTQRLVEDWAKDIQALSEGERIERTITDHDAEGRATLERHLKIITTPARKDVSDGIQAVQVRLRKAGDGKPRLFIFRDALVDRDPNLIEHRKPCGLVDEFDGYVWQKMVDGKPNKEEPVKDGDHSLDALRYLVMYFDAKAKGKIVSWS